MDIAVTTTAMLRPELLERTYDTFSKNLIDVDFASTHLYINVDPAPDGHATVAEVLKVANKFFDKVTARCPDTPNFSEAINHVWGAAHSAYILHLEDDWELMRPVSVAKMIEQMHGFKPNLHQMRFRGRRATADGRKIGLSPSIICREFYSKVAGKLDPKINPEVQLHVQANLQRWGIPKVRRSAGVYTDRVGRPIIRDIGREWAEEHKVYRPIKAKFVKWV